MKKILICLFCLFLTGCVSNEDFEKTCTKVTNSENIKDTYIINVTYDNKDTVKKAIVTRKYKSLNDEGKKVLENIKESATTYNEKYADNDNIKITVSKDEDDEWQLKYYLTVPKLSDDILEEFMIRKNSIRFFNKMKDENMNCK